jgi:hypothetical protein
VVIKAEGVLDMTIEEVLKHDEKFRYMLLDRMKMDCLYFLGNGNRCKKYLWAGDEAEQIKYMKAIYNSLDDDKKPEWLSMEEIIWGLFRDFIGG